MEDSSPPDQKSPLSAGDLLAEPKARLTKPSARSETSTKLPEGKTSLRR